MQPPSESPPRWNQRRAASFVFPLLLVVVGGVLLLNNLGVLPWSVWTALGRLWPVVLILFGIDLLLGRRRAWFGILVILIVLLGVLAVSLWTPSSRVVGATTASVSQIQSLPVPLDGVKSGQVTVQFGAGALHVGSPPADPTTFAQAMGSLPSGVQLTRKANTSNGVADVTYSTEGAAGFWPFRSIDQDRGGLTLDVQLAPKVPLTIRSDVGAGQSTFDLTNLQVENFTLNNGAGQATVMFPASAGHTNADIHSGAGQLTLNIPDDVGATIHTNNGLVNVHASDRFQKVGDSYQTSDYGTAANRLDVTLHVGIGEVDVQ